MEERKAILRIKVSQKKQTLADSALENIARKMDGFNGADIESVVNEAVEKCFLESLEKENVTFDENSFKDATTGKTL